MQKKLIALAVASVASGAAFAQTNVTMYGIADAGYVYSTGKANIAGGGTNKYSGIDSGLLSGSRLGFKGEEALGNGLKAIFQLEYGLSIDSNVGVGTALAPRQQFVGLSSNALGTVALGRQYAPGYDATARNDAFAGAAFAPQSFLTTSTDVNNTITPNSGARWNNAVTYTTPNWGGFTGKAIYGFGENAGNDRFVSTSDNGRWGVGANFSAGMFNVDGVYQVRQNVVAANGKDINEWYVGATLDLKFAKLMASYQDQNDKNTLTNNDNSTWSVGAVIPVMSSSAIHLGYAELDFDQGNKGAQLNGKSKAAAVAFSHGLSKRTTLYTGYVYTKNGDDSVGAAPAGLTNVIGAVDRKNHTFTAGIRHTF